MALEVLFGWLASGLCTLILVPQIFKAVQTRHTNDISMFMLILSISGNGFWAAHALLTQNLPLLVGASLISIMSIVLIVLKYLFDNK